MSLLSNARAAAARFDPAVWRVLLHSTLIGLALSIADLLFNFYLVSAGYGNDVAGDFSTLYRVAGVVFGLPIGLMIDRIGARRALLVGVFGYAAAWVLLLSFNSFWALAIAQFLIGAASITAGTAAVPLLTQVTSDGQRATVFGWNASVGLMIGLLGSVVAGQLPGIVSRVFAVGPQTTFAYRGALTLVVVLALISALPVLWGVREEPRADRLAAVANDTRPPLSVRRMLRICLPAWLLGIGGGAILPFHNLFFRDVYGLSDAAVGAVLATVAVGQGVGGLITGVVAARFGVQRAAWILRLGAAPAMLLMLVPSLPVAITGYFLRGFCIVASFPLNDTLTMQIVPRQQRGRVLSIMSMTWSLGWAMTSPISGRLQLAYGFTPVLLIAAISYVLSAWAIATLRMPAHATG